MVYVKVQVNITEKQFKQLVKGQNARIDASQIGNGQHTLFLTKSQVKKLKTNYEKGRKTTIHFSNAQVKHNAKHGSGLWDTIKNIGKKIYNDTKPVAGVVGKYAFDRAKDKLVPIIKEKGDQLLDSAIGTVERKLTGRGRFQALPMTLNERERYGEGFFDDLWGGVKSIGSQVVPKLVDIGINKGLERLSRGKGKGRSRRSRGGGVLPPGY